MIKAGTTVNLEGARIGMVNNCSVNITGQCPHCSISITYCAVETLFSFDMNVCPNCGKHFTVNAIDYCDHDKLNENVGLLLKEGSVAVWAVTCTNFHWLLKAVPALKADNAFFINKNEIIIPHNGAAVKSLGGKPVCLPEIINDFQIDTIIVPNSLKVYSEIKDQCLVEFPGVKRVVHIAELIS